jgi:glycosyltransferase involved in cell wall biosynthesis
MNIKLLIVGGGPERESLERLSIKLGVDDRVSFTGRAEDAELPDLYAACDAWVTASRHEGFCVPIVEAMAAGRPVIVPDLAAMPETAGGAGLVYRSGDLADLAAKIRALAADKNVYTKLSNEANIRAGQFNINEVMDRYMDVLLTQGAVRGR